MITVLVSFVALIRHFQTEQYEKRKELGIEIKTDEWEKYLLNSPIINTKHLSINQLRYYLGEGQKLVQ